jgi:hypothetical protein
MKRDDELAPELAKGIHRVGAIAGAARELLLGMSEAQLNWKPSPNRWSIGENVLHMRGVNARYLDAMEEAIEKARTKKMFSGGPFRYGWLDRWFLSQVEPPPKRRLKAPRIFVPASPRADRKDVDEFLGTLDRLSRAMHSVNGLDLARVKVASPLTRLLRFSLGTCLLVLTAHSERHLQQARGVAGESQFPRGGAT